jgi:asparagine synthase (glutamine-hydrolysing)
MVGIAVVICWDGNPAAEEIARQMLDQLRHRGGRQRLLRPKPGVSLGIVDSGRVAESPLPANHSWCVADMRLDNRADLRRVCLATETASDTELLAAGYERWETALADHLRGDFALALWDTERDCLYAARDPFGVRPLFYHRSAGRVLLASEIQPLLAAGAGQAGLEDRVVLDYLQMRHRHGRQTLFRGIQRILPGHWHCFGPQAVRAQRYWWPPRHDIVFRQQADYYCEFRRLFRAAVASRLDADRPLVAQMSGGLDSTAVVCMADDILRNGDKKTSVHVASFVYPGLACDETCYIDTVARQIRLPVHRYPGAAPATFEAPDSDSIEPDWMPAPRGPESDLGLASQLSATGILSGTGADELLFEGGVFTDLAARGHWLTLLTQTVGTATFYSTQAPWGFLWEAIRRASPASLRRLYRRLRPAERPAPPSWLGPRLRPLWDQAPSEPNDALALRSATLEATWRSLTNPAFSWQTEWEVLRAARQGLAMRFPYLDRPLVEFVMAVPFERRLPRGRMKLLLRKAMAGLVPKPVLARTKLTLFDCLQPLDFQINRAHWQALLHEGPWLSEPFVDRGAACELFYVLDKSFPAWSNPCGLLPFRAVIHLEKWLRAIWKSGFLGTI